MYIKGPNVNTCNSVDLILYYSVLSKCDGIASDGRVRWCNVLATSGVLVLCESEARNFVVRVGVGCIAQ